MSANHQPPISIAHVPDFYKRYPGESLTLFTRLQIHRPVSGLRLKITLPAGLIGGNARASVKHNEALPALQPHAVGQDVIWLLSESVEAGTVINYELEAQIAPTQKDLTLVTLAAASAQHKKTKFSVTESAAVFVKAKGNWLNYLPALYEQDDLMGRLLMLFESFWQPLEGQIDALPHYFDPRLTPPDFLPWLASWLHLTLDERWPEEKRRLLLRSAAWLYRMRGTKAGLQRYLEIYTGEIAEITEHRVNNFCLGKQARLGDGIALGRNNIPHTFDVTLRLPPADLPAPRQRAAKETERRRIIEQIIEAEKPAHTKYQLTISNE